jgi:hypothetical protein
MRLAAAVVAVGDVWRDVAVLVGVGTSVANVAGSVVNCMRSCMLALALLRLLLLLVLFGGFAVLIDFACQKSLLQQLQSLDSCELSGVCLYPALSHKPAAMTTCTAR